ncbi:MAG: gliding motility protein GldN [Bacteroidaceae bacterium]|nr:gliding motility protein GldN [Bacteroidaceae bacterium]
MKYISKILLIVCVSLLGQYAAAQPPKRKNEAAAKAAVVVSVPMTDRAKAQFPTSNTPTEVVWKRDMYRTLDLKKEKNASLYYPVEPQGENMNLFTYLFKLFVNKQIPAYRYNLDGNESFTADNRVDPKELLDDYGIYYEEKNGAIVVEQSDIPSAQVLSYYIKESYFYDQRTATYNQRVTAICPVVHKASDFSSEVTKYPMFWLNFDEIAPLLAQQKVMSSSYNNVSTMTLSDYFAKNCYEGEIYKTVNLRNLSINQYCKDDSAVKKEQRNIEKQLKDFRENLWKVPAAKEEPKDSTATAAADSTATEKPAAKEEKQTKRTTKKSSDSKASKSSSKSSGGSGAPRVSVRRTRR